MPPASVSLMRSESSRISLGELTAGLQHAFEGYTNQVNKYKDRVLQLYQAENARAEQAEREGTELTAS